MPAIIDSFRAEFLSHGTRAGDVVRAAELDPDCALAQAYAAALHLSLQTADGVAAADAPIARAVALAGRADEWERAVVMAFAAWHGDRPTEAAARFTAIVESCPRDLISAKFAQLLHINLGDVRGMMRVANAIDEDAPYAGGLIAFAAEQTGDIEAAERIGRGATARDADDPWAHHAVAHAVHNRDGPDAVLAWMLPLGDRWDRCSSFMYTHSWWHVALAHLAQGNHAAALALYDDRIWGVRKTYVQDQVNAISLLARLELAGADVGDRWNDLADHAAARAADQLNPFHDFHMLHALLRAGRIAEARDTIAAIEDRAARIDAAEAFPWRAVALPYARGLSAWAAGDHLSARRAFHAATPTLVRGGGSNVQRELFLAIAADNDRLLAAEGRQAAA
ncbi:MAG: tetratricopeptide repeat protein [Pseudomonadota bacterium]